VLGEVLHVHAIRPRAQIPERIAELLSLVGLPADSIDRTPRHFSGGQRQRIGIARALAMEPRFIVADEPVSAVDVSVQSQIMNLLLDLRDRLGLTLLFIAHDLSVVRYLSDRVGVMYLGRIVETGTRDQIFTAPRHPYTQALLSAAPRPDPAHRGTVAAIGGEPPSPLDPPIGLPLPHPLPARHRPVPQVAPVPETSRRATWSAATTTPPPSRPDPRGPPMAHDPYYELVPEPTEPPFDAAKTALLIIDLQYSTRIRTAGWASCAARRAGPTC
jgi:oligopeptide/dipeptide ABC transporter ATP-binding protein